MWMRAIAMNADTSTHKREENDYEQRSDSSIERRGKLSTWNDGWREVEEVEEETEVEMRDRTSTTRPRRTVAVTVTTAHHTSRAHSYARTRIRTAAQIPFTMTRYSSHKSQYSRGAPLRLLGLKTQATTLKHRERERGTIHSSRGQT